MKEIENVVDKNCGSINYTPLKKQQNLYDCIYTLFFKIRFYLHTSLESQTPKHFRKPVRKSPFPKSLKKNNIFLKMYNIVAISDNLRI